MSKSPTLWMAAAATLLILSGCHDSTAPRDVSPPASPRGVFSVTGDHQVVLRWLGNTEADLYGYRIYESPCATGSSCPYDRIGTTAGTQFTVQGLSNGVTRYFAVSAVDAVGNESELTREDVFDTPRPEGFSRILDNYLETPANAGWDFSAASVRAFDDPGSDVFYGSNNGVFLMFTPFTDTDIQDAGYATSLDAIDFAPNAGWSPTGSVELIVGHCYVVWTHDDHYAKFRVTSLDSHRVTFDWAYQLDPGNRELKVKRVRGDGTRIRRTIRFGS